MEAVVLYKSHPVMKQQVSVYIFVHVLPLPVVPGGSSQQLCRKPSRVSRNASPARAGGDTFWKGRSPGCLSCGPVPVNGMQVIHHCVIWSCDKSVALALVIKQESFLVSMKSDEAYSV